MSTETISEESKLKISKRGAHYLIAQRITNDENCGIYTYCLEEDCFYIYKEGVWQHIYEMEQLSKLCKEIPGLNKMSMAERRQVLENLKMISFVHLNIFNNIDMLNMPNGMVNPYQGEIDAHGQELYSTIRLPYSYVEDMKCELWLKTLNEIFEGDHKKIDVLQEFFGYCLTRDTSQHKSLLLLGESRSGKSTILNVLRSVIGNKNCSSVPLKFISNPQYTPMLINKLVNIDTDVSAKASEFEAEFKTITSGEPVSCNQKFVAAFEFVPYCKIVMAANIFPKITDHSSAFYKRLILIPCDRVFSEEEQNKNLKEELTKELPGILNWAMAGLKRLKERGRFEQNDFMKDAIQELEDENNPINIFFQEHIEVAFDEYIEKGDLYKYYKSWCDSSRNYILSQARFASCVFKKFHKETPKQAHLPNGRRIWRNLRYIDIKQYTNNEKIDWKG